MIEPTKIRTPADPKFKDQRPEALAQFGESAREENPAQSSKSLKANAETSPVPTDNRDKHDVATRLLNDGAHGVKPDPDVAGEDRLPNRIAKKR